MKASLLLALASQAVCTVAVLQGQDEALKLTPKQRAIEMARREQQAGGGQRFTHLQALKKHLQTLAANKSEARAGDALKRRLLQGSTPRKYTNYNAACRKAFTGVGTQPLKTAVVLFTYPREQLSGYTDATVEAMYRDDPTVVTYYKNLWRDMFTQSCDDQSIMPINEAYHGMSFGQLTYHGEAGSGGLDVYGVVHLTSTHWQRALDNGDYVEDYLVNLAGIASKRYDLVIYVAVLCGDDAACDLCQNPDNSFAYCGGALGWPAMTSGGQYSPGGVWIGLNDDYSTWQQVLVGHELGHRWYDHASTLERNPKTGVYVHQEYGDVTSMMGNGFHFVTSAMYLRAAGLIPSSAFVHVPVSSLPSTGAGVPVVGPGGADALLGQPGVFRLTNTNKPAGSSLVAGDVASLVVDLPRSAAWGQRPLNSTYFSFAIQFFKSKDRDGWQAINKWNGQSLYPTHGVWVQLMPGAIQQDWIDAGRWLEPNAYGMFNDASKASITVPSQNDVWDITFNAKRARAELLITPGQTLTTAWTRSFALKVTLLALDANREWAVVHVAQAPAK